MADRTSAGLFGSIFQLLAGNPTDEHKEMAKKIWPLTRYYDFNYYQMYVDDELIRLGLAKKGINPKYPNEGETILYANNDGVFQD